MSAFTGWENFYVIVGSSAGALIGLQFVVLSLVSRRPVKRGEAQQAGDAFATPSVVHFAVVLLLSAVMSVPWNGINIVSALWGIIGVSGVVYTIIVARRMRLQTVYQPIFYDWTFHVLLPFAAYIILALSAFMASSYMNETLFGVGISVLVLLFIGIHNAWDAVTYHLYAGNKRQRDDEEHQ